MTIWGSFLRGRRRKTSNSPELVTSGLPPRELTPHPPSRQRYHSAPGTVQISPSFKAGLTSSGHPATELSRTISINDVPSSIATPLLTHRICLVPYLDSNHIFHFEPIFRDLIDGETPVRIGRFSGHSASDARSTNEITFDTRVLSRLHAEIWSDNGKIYIKDTKSSSGTFLNHVHINCPGSGSAPYQLKDGDFVQLGVDYQGGVEDIYKSVRIRIEIGRDFTQPYSHVANNELSSDHGGTNTHSQESLQEPGSCSSFIIPTLTNTAGHDAWMAQDLCTAEKLLTKEIDADHNNHHVFGGRSVMRARRFKWDNALQDALISIAIQPSLKGYISKGIALCGKQQLWDAMEAFDLALSFSNDNRMTVEILLIKAIALFNSSRHNEAIRRVQDLAAACQSSETLQCSVVDSYLHVQHAMIVFEGGHYSEAADKLTAGITTIADRFLRPTLYEPIPGEHMHNLDRYVGTFTELFGWDFGLLWQTANQRRCEAFLCADRVIEAAGPHQYMMLMISEAVKPIHHEWSAAFKHKCTSRCVTKGDEAVTASNYEMAVELYSVGISLDSSCESLFARRSKANLTRRLYTEALDDAEKVIELNPSSYTGYKLKYAVLHELQRYDEAIEALKIMLLKLDNAIDPEIRELRQQYVSPSEAHDAIQRAVNIQLENAPLRLVNTFTGRLCDRQTQINTFIKSEKYKEVLSSLMAHATLQTELIKAIVTEYFSWVMLSHRWESKEPRLHDIQDKDVYTLASLGTVLKLQTFCKTARDAGYRWAWSDTCCIDQSNNFELQESVNSMFVWYGHSALTIIYLADVLPWSEPGALANSTWNTRGWTVQEFLAPHTVRFYRADWTLYLNDHSPNHKMSIAIMQELEDSTGIDAQALIAFRPGMRGAREKLQWASSRVTTLQEDIAYSLFGIFHVHLPVIYGEKRQNALGRLLQEIIAHSGDITPLDWIGKASEFNSCLPADITSYKAPPCMLSSLPEDEMNMSVSMLRNTVSAELTSKLYTLLENLSAPRFAQSRLQLPCIVFPITELRRRRGPDPETYFTYDIKADGLQDLLITSKDKLIQFSPTRPIQQTFLLVRPWNRHDLGLPDFAEPDFADD
ncbi:uncharacterized protein HD556DRAFT_1275673, partial [Suillus plorans]